MAAGVSKETSRGPISSFDRLQLPTQANIPATLSYMKEKENVCTIKTGQKNVYYQACYIEDTRKSALGY